MKLKKKIILTAVSMITLGCIGNAVYAVSDFDKNGVVDIKDVQHLVSVFNGKSEITSDDDVNGDKVFNILDMIELKSLALEQELQGGEIFKTDYKAVSENVKLVGRTYTNKDVTWLVHSGSAAEFDIIGTSAELTLAGDWAVNSDEKYQPRYAVFVDGEQLEDSLLNKKEKKITLFKSESQKRVNVKVIHLSEANNGAIGISNIQVTSAAKVPVKPVPKKQLHIEFIGDSITCAYGVEGASNQESFKTSTENFMKSYAYLASQKLDADYSAVSYSGYGIISGYTSTNSKNTESLLPDCYNLIGKLNDYAHEWNFESHKNDVVFINLGTNDASFLKSDFDEYSPEFVTEYVKFLKDVRDKNPDAHIICTVGTMGCYEVYDLIEDAVSEYTKATSDKKITCYRSTTQNGEANGYGSDWHPSEITQQMSAYVAADKICEVLGIESDKIGLDAAENGKYDISVNEEVGANAAKYLGYDKSFWVNTVVGGTQSSDIQARVSGLKLKAGGEYKLEFDCVSNKIIKMQISVKQDHDEKMGYFGDIMEVTEEKKHYSQTFSLEKDDDNCAIVFGIGGTDYCNVTFSNVSLVKIS